MWYSYKRNHTFADERAVAKAARLSGVLRFFRVLKERKTHKIVRRGGLVQVTQGEEINKEEIKKCQ